MAPSEFLKNPVSAAFGAVAESIVEGDYLREMRRSAFYPLSHIDFADFSHGFGNTAIYIAFLKTNNPRLSVSQLAVLSAGGDLKIPDLMTHDPAGQFEFYEVKPNSIDGRAAGHVKVALIEAVMSGFRLPYASGLRYTPNKRIRIYSGVPLGARLEVFFHFERIAPGLIVYDICAEGELEKLGLALLLAILALIIAILLRGRVPGGAPVPVPAFA